MSMMPFAHQRRCYHLDATQMHSFEEEESARDCHDGESMVYRLFMSLEGMLHADWDECPERRCRKKELKDERQKREALDGL